MRRLSESRGPYGTLDLPGLLLAARCLRDRLRPRALAVARLGSPSILASLIVGAVLLAAFVVWERRARYPMLPMSFFAKRSFAVTNVVSLAMYFGMFGSIFFLSQYMQDVLGNTPLQAGLKLLVWTGASMVVAPLAGIFSERFGSRPFMVAGLTLQALGLGWLALMTATHVPYTQMVIPFIMAGAGMSLVFAPSANAVLSSVRVDQAGQASGANNAIREVGGVLGVAVLATVFTGAGGYGSPQEFVNGLIPAMWVGVAVLGAGALVALLLPFRTPRAAEAAALAAEQEHAEQRLGRAAAAGAGGRAGVSMGSSQKDDAPRARAGHAVRRRVPAAERREALIVAAVHEFALSGLHGTPVDRIARRVGVAQPYVFSLFAGKRELFIAAVEHCFDRFAETFTQAAAEYRAGRAPAHCEDVLMAMGGAYKQLLGYRPRLSDAPASGLRGLRRRAGASARTPPLGGADGAGR